MIALVTKLSKWKMVNPIIQQYGIHKTRKINMRRIKAKQANAKEVYIKARISQLMDDMNRAHDQHDKNWYNRLIQELNWVQQVETKPDHNCYMEKGTW